MKLALRDVIASRPVRTVKALLMRAIDARASLRAGKPDAGAAIERVRGLDGAVTIGRDGHGVPGVFATTLADLAFGMGWACAEDRLFQIELMRRAMRGELAATFGARAVDPDVVSKMLAGRTFVDLDLFTRSMGFRAAAEASWAICSEEGRRWVDAYAMGINAYLASGRRPVEMLLLDVEPAPWTGIDAMLVAKATAFQLSFSYRFALAHALIQRAVDAPRAQALWPVRHPLHASLAAVVATTETLRDVLGSEGVHLGSNAFAVAPHRSSLGRAIVASDPHMPPGAPGVFWEVRLSGAGLDVRGFGVPGFPALPIGQNARGAWAVTAGWGDDTQLYVEDLGRLRAEGRLRTIEETIEVRGGEAQRFERLETPRGPVVSPTIGADVLGEHGSAHGGEHDIEQGLVLRWSGQDASPDADAALALLRADSFGALREALRLHAAPTLNFVWGDADGHIGWQYAGRIPQRRGNLEPVPGATPIIGLDLLDGEDPRGHWQGYVPFDALPRVLDPRDGVVVSANVDPGGAEHGHMLGALFEPPFRFARIHALLDAHGVVGPNEIAAIQRDARSAWAEQMRDALLDGLDDATLALPPRRGRELVQLARAWDGVAGEESTGAVATYALIDAVVRHLFLEDLGDEAFERYFEIMNVGALPTLQLLRGGVSAWLEGRDRATLVRDAAAMAEGRLRRRLGDEPRRWQWGALHAITFRHPLATARSAPGDGVLGPGLRALVSPGPYPARGDGTTVCMGEHDLRGNFQVRVAPSLRATMIAGAPDQGRAVMPPGQSGDPSSRHYRDQVRPYLAGETRAASWHEADFAVRRVRLVEG